MKPPFLGRRFNNLFARRRPTLRSLRTFYNRAGPNGEQAQYDHKNGGQDGYKRRKKRFLYSRMAEAWYNTPTKWYPLPVGIGAVLLGVIQFRKNQQKAIDSAEVVVDEHGESVKLQGPWQVHVLGALPLRNLSRLWGYLNEVELPVWFRPYGFRFYAWIFGCNLQEIETEDLTIYPSLGAFFYRGLKPGVRPIANSALVSPADGTILHFGTIDDHHRIEQVKGVTYSLDALLGLAGPKTPASQTVLFEKRETGDVDDREFANVNGIEYSLDQLLGRGGKNAVSESGSSTPKDAAASPTSSIDSLVRDSSLVGELGSESLPPVLKRTTSGVKPTNKLYFTVIYLAPGDYHRFHSPTAWVVEKRRHFAGELFSVSPYIARRLANLFVLNERVALLGRWKHGFFSMVPVGATNVGSIKVNFDKHLRTNLPTRPPPPSPGTYYEAIYASASPLLQGQPLVAGQEMGGFSLGSTIVLVFEAPPTFEFDIHAGQKVKVGQSLGNIVP
ncbi:phosphatidylserine decarboxylase 1 [Tulasnella sp. 419]|nr:phosphatidylserine decarboxylase 1 [Tulasnella sp. 418]KAG8962277.1 phosphatidylserine decarboxylase 1 [Tulasnella sp. 419]